MRDNYIEILEHILFNPYIYREELYSYAYSTIRDIIYDIKYRNWIEEPIFDMVGEIEGHYEYRLTSVDRDYVAYTIIEYISNNGSNINISEVELSMIEDVILNNIDKINDSIKINTLNRKNVDRYYDYLTQDVSVDKLREITGISYKL